MWKPATEQRAWLLVVPKGSCEEVLLIKDAMPCQVGLWSGHSHRTKSHHILLALAFRTRRKRKQSLLQIIKLPMPRQGVTQSKDWRQSKAQVRQDPGLDTGLAGSACAHVTARGAEKKVHGQEKQSGEKQGSRGTETTGWDLSWVLHSQRDRQHWEDNWFLPSWLFLGGSSDAPLWAAGQLQWCQAWEVRGHSVPACSSAQHRPCRGVYTLHFSGECLKPSSRWGYPSALQISTGPFPQQPWKVLELSSTARQQGPDAALSGWDFPENVHETAKVTFREGAAGRKLM